MNFIFFWKSAVLFTICFKVHIILSTAPDNVSANASSPCEEGWEHHGEFCIIMEKQPKYWRQASSNCISMGGHLASIHSKEQNDLYLDLSQTAGINNLWIGLSDHVSNSIFEWQDGTVFDYKYWADPKCIPLFINIISHYRCFEYCIRFDTGHFRRIFGNYRQFEEDYYPFCDCRCHPVEAFSTGDCVALSTSERGKWRGKHCSSSYAYLCQKKITATTIAGAQDSDENVTATSNADTQANDKNEAVITVSTIIEKFDVDNKTAPTIIENNDVDDKEEPATMITRTEVDNPTSTAIISTVMEVKTASTNISSIDLDDKTVETTIITRTDVNRKTAAATIDTSTDVSNGKTALATNLTDVDDKTAAATIDTSTDINNGNNVIIITMNTEEADVKNVAKYNGEKQDDKSSWFSIKTFIIILCIIVMFMALVGGMYYYKRPWLEKQKLNVTTVFFRRLRTANRPSSSFVLNRNENCDGSIDKYTTRYVSLRNNL